MEQNNSNNVSKQLKPAKYRKLRDGAWGAWVSSPEFDPPQPQEVVSVTTKAGAVKQERIGRILFSNHEGHLCELVR